MLEFIKENLGTIAVSVLIAVGVILAVRKLYRDKKLGKGSCGCNCAGCMHSHMCHSNKKDSDDLK